MLMPKEGQAPQSSARTHEGQEPSAVRPSPLVSSACRRSNPDGLRIPRSEAARVAMTRHIRRGGRVWVKDFPGQTRNCQAC